MDSKRTRHAAYQINDHVVGCPKVRRPVLGGDVGVRLAALILQIVKRKDGEVLDLVVQPDHVPLFASFPPPLAANQIEQCIKGATSRQLRQAFPELKSPLPSLWTGRYYGGTAGHVSPATIRRYIDAQKGR